MPNIKINGSTYSGVTKIETPLADGSGNKATFYDTSGANISADDVRKGKYAYGHNTGVVTGTMPEIEAKTTTLNQSKSSHTIERGYHDGNGKVKIDIGTADPVTPSSSSQVVTAEDGKLFQSVTVNPVPAAKLEKTYTANGTYKENMNTEFFNEVDITVDVDLPEFTLQSGVLYIS